MASAGESSKQEDQTPDVLLARLINRLDLHEGAADFIQAYNAEQHKHGSDEDFFRKAESRALSRLPFSALDGKEELVKTALSEARQIYDDSLAHSPLTHCEDFREENALVTWSHRIEEALYEGVVVDAAVKELEGLMNPVQVRELRSICQSSSITHVVPGYPYRQLNSREGEIRLLVLLPNVDDTATIQCQLISCNKESKTYVALSYCWGKPDPGNSSTIELEGQPVKVTPNLLAALKRLRNKSTRMYLWVDALCINQDDIPERSEQVSQMKEIYQKAVYVVCFLGEEEDQSNLAMDFLLKFETQEDFISSLQELWSENSEPRMYALQALLRREYWKRVWIMQEIVLARKSYICCGEYAVSWTSFVWFFVPLSSSEISSSATTRMMYTAVKTTAKAWVIPLISLWHKNRYGLPVSSLDSLVQSRQRKATDLHDHVYGVIGFLDEWSPGVDYKTPVPLFYLAVALRFILEEGNLDILTMCKNFDPEFQGSKEEGVENIVREAKKALKKNRGVTEIDSRGEIFTIAVQAFDLIETKEYTIEKLPVKEATERLWTGVGLATLPSWAPRLNDTTISPSQYILLNPKRRTEDRASGGLPAEVNLVSEGKELLIKGLILDSIDCISEHISQPKVLPKSFQSLMASGKHLAKDLYEPIRKDWALWEKKTNKRHDWKVWEKKKDKAQPYNPYGGLDEQKVAYTATTLVGVQISDPITEKLSKDLVAYWSGWTENGIAFSNAQSIEDLTDITVCSSSHQFFITKKKYMGRGPSTMKKGDLVCVLYGGNVPFVLRPWAGKHFLIGECYVHGVMSGEAIAMRDAGELEEQQLILM